MDIHLNLEGKIVQKLDAFCENRGENRSTLIRRIIYRELAKYDYLGEEKKKAVLKGWDDEQEEHQ